VNGMKRLNEFQVFKIGENHWRWSNLRDIGGDCDTFEEAIAEASDIAWLSKPLAEVCS